MPPDAIASGVQPSTREGSWPPALFRLWVACAAVLAVTLSEWRAMFHQWWNIDTYAHILLVPPIIVWLVWLRRHQFAQLVPQSWRGGLAIVAGGLAIAWTGRTGGINLVAEFGVIVTLIGTIATVLGARVALVGALPLAYAFFLVPFGDEIVPQLQDITARIAVALTHLSGVPATLNGLFIDTPAGRFVVAEECSGVKFLVAMIALATLVAWTGFHSIKRRALFVAGAAVTSILANGVRAWGTIYVAQYIGAKRAGGFDHIVYGWVFFAVIITLLLAAAWRFAEQEPSEAGLSAEQADAIASRFDAHPIPPDLALASIAAMAIGFAALSVLV